MKKKKKITKKQPTTAAIKDPHIKKHETFDINLTRFELLHIRDLMGVLLPSDGAQTLSQALAFAEERTMIESMLWDKVSRLCKQAKLPLEAEAPDYIVAPIAPPPMGVFQVNQDLQDMKKVHIGGFLPDDEEEVTADEEG